MTISKLDFLEMATKQFGAGAKYENKDLLAFAASMNIHPKSWRWLFRAEYKVSRGNYKLPVTMTKKIRTNRVKVSATAASNVVNMAPTAEIIPMRAPTQKFNPNAASSYDHATVPAKDTFYVPFGEFKDVERIIRSGAFFPIFISGLSGNGKTFMVEQAAARADRPMVRLQMSRETDEDDLIGGFRLINGETKFMKGPVLRAMEMGALLLIDEADRADPGKVMCLQGILEGKSYNVKKTGEVVTPVPGFNVIVTANTKGKGSDDGRYVAAGILDDAWLERFPITIEQQYPNAKIETRILTGYLCHDRDCTAEDHKFVEHLVMWGDITRRTFEEGAIDEVISTRRLVHIINTYRMFGDREKSIKLCINRFDTETKNSFMELYTKIDPTIVPIVETVVAPIVEAQAATAATASE